MVSNDKQSVSLSEVIGTDDITDCPEMNNIAHVNESVTIDNESKTIRDNAHSDSMVSSDKQSVSLSEVIGTDDITDCPEMNNIAHVNESVTIDNESKTIRDNAHSDSMVSSDKQSVSLSEVIGTDDITAHVNESVTIDNESKTMHLVIQWYQVTSSQSLSVKLLERTISQTVQR